MPSEVGVHLDHGIARIKRKQKGGVRTLHLPLPVVRNEKVITKKSVLKKKHVASRGLIPREFRVTVYHRARAGLFLIVILNQPVMYWWTIIIREFVAVMAALFSQ